MFFVDGDAEWIRLRVRDKMVYSSGVLACGVGPSLMVVVAATPKKKTHVGM